MASTNFYELSSHLESVKNTCEGKKTLKLAKTSVLVDYFHGFRFLWNLMKRFNVRLQVFRWQFCFESALFSLYIPFVKSVCIRSFSGPYLSVSVGKIRTRKTLNTDTFHAMKNFMLFYVFGPASNRCISNIQATIAFI